MAASKRIYTATWDWNLVPGALNIELFAIESNNRELKIRSITLDWLIWNITTNLRIPAELCTTQQLQLQVGIAGVNMSHVYTGVGITPILNGEGFMISRPCQLLFDTFYVRNMLSFGLSCCNREAVNNIRNEISIIVETEEKILYQ